MIKFKYSKIEDRIPRFRASSSDWNKHTISRAFCLRSDVTQVRLHLALWLVYEYKDGTSN